MFLLVSIRNIEKDYKYKKKGNIEGYKSMSRNKLIKLIHPDQDLHLK